MHPKTVSEIISMHQQTEKVENVLLEKRRLRFKWGIEAVTQPYLKD